MKWLFIGLLGLAVLLLLIVASADAYFSSERGVKWLYSEIEQPVQIRYSPDQVRYLQIGDSTKTPLLLIHGAPGGLYDWLGMAKQKNIYSQYYLLIPERLGYGKTRPRSAEPSVLKQSRALVSLLTAQNKPVVVMGHSYGGPIAVALGSMAPEYIEQIYAVSGAYDPEQEVTFGISYWLDFHLFRYLLPRPIWVSNVEKLRHPDALREAVSAFKSVSVPTTLVHGTADGLVPYGNSTYLKEMMPMDPPLISLPDHDHPVHVMMPEYFAQLLLGQDPTPPEVKK